MILHSEHNTNIIENLDIISYYDENNIIQLYEVYPLNSYVIRIGALDEYQTDEEGKLILNETNDKVFIKPYYAEDGVAIPNTYDWETNPNEYSAVLYNDNLNSEIFEASIEQELSNPIFIELLEFSNINLIFNNLGLFLNK